MTASSGVILVGARDRVAEECSPERVDVELDRQRPGRNRGETCVAEALALDFPVDAVLVGALEHLPIGVAAHEAHVWHGCETVEDLHRESAALNLLGCARNPPVSESEDARMWQEMEGRP